MQVVINWLLTSIFLFAHFSKFFPNIFYIITSFNSPWNSVQLSFRITKIEYMDLENFSSKYLLQSTAPIDQTSINQHKLYHHHINQQKIFLGSTIANSSQNRSSRFTLCISLSSKFHISTWRHDWKVNHNKLFHRSWDMHQRLYLQ